MIRTFFFILFSFFLSNCSLNEDSKLWKTKNIQKDKNITTILTEEKKFSKEFNPKIKLDLPKAKNRIIDNLNNFERQCVCILYWWHACDLNKLLMGATWVSIREYRHLSTTEWRHLQSIFR